MTWPAYLSAFLALTTLGLAFFCCRRRHLLLALPLALLCLCLALALAFNALFLLAAGVSDPALALVKMIFWAGWLAAAMSAVDCSILWLTLSWRPVPWLAKWQRTLTASLLLFV